MSATKTDTTKDQQEDVGVSKRELLQEAEAVCILHSWFSLRLDFCFSI
jgi:hypothetical protein